MPGRSKPRVNQGFFAGQDPEPGGRGVSEGMRVAVGKGVEEGSSVTVGATPISARVASAAGCWVPSAAGSGSAFRQPPSRARASITPTIKAFFTFTLVASILLTEDPFYPGRAWFGILLFGEPYPFHARSVNVSGIEGIPSGRYHFPGSFSTRKAKWR
jgi:hypothetical protein